MANTIFIENLPSHVDVSNLCEIFGKYGRILTAGIEFDKNMSSLCKGHICYDNHSSANCAVQEMNGKKNHGKIFYVKMGKKLENISNDELYKKVHVKNVDLDWDNYDLIGKFERFGKIDVAHIFMTDGKSKGCGYVTFFEHSSAKDAVETMNNKMINNRKLIVEPFIHKNQHNYVKPFVNSTENVIQSNNLFIKNLPKDVDDDELRHLFQKFGSIQSVKVARDDLQKSKGYGFVCFLDEKVAAKACNQMDCFSYKSKILQVKFYEKRRTNSFHPERSHSEVRKFNQQGNTESPSNRVNKNTIFSFSAKQ